MEHALISLHRHCLCHVLYQKISGYKIQHEQCLCQLIKACSYHKQETREDNRQSTETIIQQIPATLKVQVFVPCKPKLAFF